VWIRNKTAAQSTALILFLWSVWWKIFFHLSNGCRVVSKKYIARISLFSLHLFFRPCVARRFGGKPSVCVLVFCPSFLCCRYLLFSRFQTNEKWNRGREKRKEGKRREEIEIRQGDIPAMYLWFCPAFLPWSLFSLVPVRFHEFSRRGKRETK